MISKERKVVLILALLETIALNIDETKGPESAYEHYNHAAEQTAAEFEPECADISICGNEEERVWLEKVWKTLDGCLTNQLL